MRLPPDDRVLVGTSTADDAGVVLVRDDLALVQTVDFFPPVVDDPTWYGRIAAANSLSDVYAMGGEPLSAVSVFAFPVDLPDNVPSEILNGAVEGCVEAGCALVGGHTVKDHEIKFGLAVTGTIHPDHIVRNATARPGDHLVLTKPLGSGLLTTALRAGALGDDETLRVMQVMAALNRGASRAMLEVGVHAATDVTGFGLLGHALGMAEPAGVSMRIRSADVPAIEGLEPFLDRRFVCGGLERNREWVESKGRVRWVDVPEARRLVLLDPQTSGGLLIAVAPDRADALLDALVAHGCLASAWIGEVLERAAWRLEVT